MDGTTGVEAWARAVLQRLAELRRSQQWLGERAAQIEGRGEAYGQGTIGGWLRTGPPKPSQAFAIERALEVKPGSQTRLLGYLPLDAKPAVTVPAAIDADGRLGDRDKRLLKRMYREALEP